MNTLLTREQIDFYRENGFVAHPNLLSQDDLHELREAVLSTIEDPRGRFGRAKIADSDSDVLNRASGAEEAFFNGVYTQHVNLWRINSTVRRYLLGADIGHLLQQLEGIGAFRVWQDQALIKEPYGNPTRWHCDVPQWSFDSPHAITIWIALEDASFENGCMWFVPESHKHMPFNPPPEREEGKYTNPGALFAYFPKLTEVDPVGVPLKAGDCTFHNGLTAHGAGSNMTRRRRIAMTCGYMPAESTFNGKRNILPKSYFDSLCQGDVLANDDWNPPVASG